MKLFLLFCFVTQALQPISAIRLKNSIEKKPDEKKIKPKGVVAVPHAYPWQVAIYCHNQSNCYDSIKTQPWKGYGGPICGGTIICPKFIITAQHCVGMYRKGRVRREPYSQTSLRVLVGAHLVNLKPSIKEMSGRFHDVNTVNGNTNFDCSILELKKAITFTLEAIPVFLPTKNDHKKYSNAFKQFAMSGWGLSDNQPKDYQPLLVASVKYFSPTKCHIDYTNTSLCAVGINGVPGFCSGNDGGPLVWLDQETSQVKLAGVVRYGINMIGRCGNGSISLQVTQILEWINDKTGHCNHETCRQGRCMTKEKLKPQALKMLDATLSPL